MFLFHLKKVVFNGIILSSFINAFSLAALSTSPSRTDDNNQQCIPVPISVFRDDVVAHFQKNRPVSYSELLEFLTKNIELMNHYLISTDELTYEKTIPGPVDIAHDKNGDIWYIRPIDRDGLFNGPIKGYYAFERIASVIASNIHNYFAQDDVSHVTIKFFVGCTAGNRRLLGTATKAKSYKPVWGGNAHYPIANPSNLEHEYAIWHFLGMSVADPLFIGLDDNEEKVVRVDFYTAFSEPSSREVTESCFETTFGAFGVLNQYKCNGQTIKSAFSKFSSDLRPGEIINECSTVLKILQIEDVDEHLSQIQNFLSRQSKS